MCCNTKPYTPNTSQFEVRHTFKTADLYLSHCAPSPYTIRFEPSNISNCQVELLLSLGKTGPSTIVWCHADLGGLKLVTNAKISIES